MTQTDTAGETFLVPPLDVSSFVGRRREIAELRGLLGESRLVTILGPGGVGKTRLAVKVADAVERAYPDGVCFIDLAASTTLEQAIEVLNTAMRLEVPGLETVVNRIGSRRMLLLFDNCEHIIDACATIVSAILRACENVRILATSREVLAVDGETVFVLDPLPVVADASGNSPAIDLFVARMSGAETGGRRDALVPTIRAICTRLDGLPLAIELAAATTRILSLPDILGRLDEPFRLPGGRRRAQPARQQTLRASIEWSYGLCTEDERQLWRWLAVFPSTFDIAAVETVVARMGLDDALGLIGALVDKSIVARSTGQSHTRYSMLFAIREFGVEKATESGERHAADAALCAWCVQFVATAERDWFSERQVDWIQRHDLEIPNIRAALDFSLGEGDPEDVFALVVPMWRVFWLSRGRALDLEALLSRAIERTDSTSPLRLNGMVLREFIVGSRDGVAAVLPELERIAAIAAEVGDERTVRSADAGIGVLTPDAEAAISRLEVAVEYGADDLVMLARTGAHIRLLLLYDRSGRVEQADRLRSVVLTRSAQTGELFDRSYLLFGLAVNAISRDEGETAVRLARESLELRSPLTPSALTAHTVEAVAAGYSIDADFRRAAWCIGLADAIWSETGVSRDTIGLVAIDRATYEGRTRAELTADDFERSYGVGRALGPADGIRRLLGVSYDGSQKRSDAESDGLTKREREVARLVALGLSNKEIATTLVVAQRTAEGHVQRILTKLGLSSRVQLAGWVRDQEDSATV